MAPHCRYTHMSAFPHNGSLDLFVQGFWLSSSWSLELGSNFLLLLYQLAFYCCDNTTTKSSLGKKSLFCLQFITHHWGKPAKCSRQEPGGRNWSISSGGVLPTGLLTMGYPSCKALDHLPRDISASSGLRPSISTSHQENAPQTCPQNCWTETVLHETPFSKWLVCVKLTKTTPLTATVETLINQSSCLCLEFFVTSSINV